MEAYQANDVETLEKELEANWPNIKKARECTPEKIRALEEALSIVLKSPDIDFPCEDISLIVFGSLARKEYTSKSDIDWTFLVDGKAEPKHLDIMLNFKKELENRGLKKPGKEGTFGGLAFSHDIIHNIGGNDDTNKNTTQRILLLLESESIGEAGAHERVIRGILNRYISEDRVATAGEIKVPRFLLNDIVRYWRTMAVDFGYKRRQRQGEGTALRNIKLRLSRKLIYASGLLACFACSIDKSMPDKYHNNIAEYLRQILQQSPLDILSSIVLSHDKNDCKNLYSSLNIVMDNYDKFLQIIDDEEKREHLEALSPQDMDLDQIYQESKAISERFQEGLEDIFFLENGTELFELIKKYGVF